jgi:hypothetical protein
VRRRHCTLHYCRCKLRRRHCTLRRRRCVSRCAVAAARCTIAAASFAVATARCAHYCRCKLRRRHCTLRRRRCVARCAVAAARCTIAAASCAVATARCTIAAASCAVATARYALSPLPLCTRRRCALHRRQIFWACGTIADGRWECTGRPPLLPPGWGICAGRLASSENEKPFSLHPRLRACRPLHPARQITKFMDLRRLLQPPRPRTAKRALFLKQTMA